MTGRRLYRLPEATEATKRQEAEVTAKQVERPCMRCGTRVKTTRNGPRFCPECTRRLNDQLNGLV
jgi:formamidopyrimidine-DNA glycosylase